MESLILTRICCAFIFIKNFSSFLHMASMTASFVLKSSLNFWRISRTTYLTLRSLNTKLSLVEYLSLFFSWSMIRFSVLFRFSLLRRNLSDGSVGAAGGAFTVKGIVFRQNFLADPALIAMLFSILAHRLWEYFLRFSIFFFIFSAYFWSFMRFFSSVVNLFIKRFSYNLILWNGYMFFFLISELLKEL